MKTLVILCAVLFGCSSLREGEHVNIAGIDFEGQAWPVDCSTDTLESLHERWEYENPYYLCDPIDAYEECSPIWVHRFRYEWAKKEFRERCEGQV